jgi:hypothetical protein
MIARDPISALAEQTIRASCDSSATPVLVIPCHLRFRGAFFSELTQRIVSTGDFHSVRFDWLIGKSLMSNRLGSRVRFWSTRRYVSKLNRSLGKAMETEPMDGTIELASQFSRPQADSCLAIGVSQSDDPLPEWCSPILAKLTCTY